MDLYEYQAKKLFAQKGIRVPSSVLIDLQDDAWEISAQRIGGFPAVIKAQVLQGGRGKSGLVKVVHSPSEAEKLLREFRERSVNRVLIEEAVDIARELYLSISIDPVDARALIMASPEGGIDIERSRRVIREKVDLTEELSPFLARDIGFELYEDRGKEIAGVLMRMFSLFREHDAELLEINPLFVDGAGEVVAGDGKVIIDDNALFRQQAFLPGREYYHSDAEYEAAREGIPYLQFEGDISLMCAGAGLTTAVYDLVHYAHGSVANYLEFGGPNYRKAQRAMELCLKNDSKVILIVTFGTIARADVMAQGVVNAIEQLRPDRPIVTCIRGTNEEEAVRILKRAGLDPLFDTEEAVRQAVALSGRDLG